MSKLSWSVVIGAVASMIAAPAIAHTGVAVSTGSAFVAGFGHPFLGADHVLAMAGLGAWSAQVGGRAVWQLPLAFLSAMAVGAMIAISGVHVPVVELGIAGSVLVVGALLALNAKMPILAAAGLAALMALFHGHAHGTELPGSADPVSYGVGFLAATMILLCAGAAAGRSVKKLAAASALRFAGAAVAVSGGVMLAA